MSGTDEAFWKQAEGDAKRTVLCEPHRLDEIQTLIDERGYDHITVRASPFCPEGKLLVIDEAAMEASQRQLFQRAGKGIRLWHR
ncbi:hypothetical protein ACKI14_02605 [Streptomyces turgidiscabies]|uniref:hypothetical protein n=1 Tax=Streptomyces turgidiscabies TaxID=85558 RepID=UPI0038F70180